jgi:hypothetical protein
MQEALRSYNGTTVLSYLRYSLPKKLRGDFYGHILRKLTAQGFPLWKGDAIYYSPSTLYAIR